jgi:hypothetical protein
MSMTTGPATAEALEAVVWIGHDEAVIVEQGLDGLDHVEKMDRLPMEREAAFDARTVDAIADQERVIVSGPAFARTGFERAYVAVTHRPDRLVDVELTVETTPRPPRPR